MIHLSPWGQRADRILDSAAIAILIGVAVIAALTFKDYGLGWDDYTQSEYGELLYRLYASGFTDRSALTFVNLFAYGGGFDLAAAIAAKILPFDLFETRRLVGAAVGLVGLALTWRVGRRIAGPLAGLFAIALLATSPTYYGHMFINCKDAPFAVAMMLVTLGLVRAIQAYPNPSVPTVTLVAIGFGLAFGTRVLGGFAALYALTALILVVAVQIRREGARPALAHARDFVVALLPGLVIAYAVMALVWPWSVVEPLNPLRATAYFSSFFEVPWRELFAGNLIRVPDMPRNYLPQFLVLQLPEAFLLLGVGGLAGSLVAAGRRDVALPLRAVLLLLASATLLPVLVVVITRPAMYNGIRHFVFLIPPLAATAGIAGAFIITRLAARSRAAATGALIAIGAALLLPISAMAALHPYQYAYFSMLAGGTAGAHGNYMLDYWGLSFKQAAQELRAKLAAENAKPPRDKWHIATCGPQRPAQVELGDGFEVSWKTAGADFALMLGEYYCLDLKAPVVVEIKRDGVVFARVYDIRGLTVPTLLAIPAP
jgi:hypothetical protein